MIVVDGTNASMGRLASYVAKEALKGNEVSVVNCNKVLITGNREFIENDFREKRGRVGSGFKGPKVSKSDEKIVKRTIRGMLPNFREGRGKEALKRVICYNKVPKDLEDKEKIKLEKGKIRKGIKLESMRK